MRFPIRALTAVLLALSVSAPVFAQSRAELASRNEALRLRVEALEARMLTGDPAAERLMARVDTLETTIRTLRGEIERLSYDRELAASKATALEDDVRRLQDLAIRTKVHLDAVDMIASQNAPQVDGTYVAGPGTVSSSPGAEPPRIQTFEVPAEGEGFSQGTDDLLEQGKSRLAEGNFAAADALLSQYLGTSPAADRAAEAHFWRGEARYVQGQFAESAESYIASMRADGTGPRAPDSLVMLSASLRELGQVGEACSALATFDSQFPNASQVARDKAAREIRRTGC